MALVQQDLRSQVLSCTANALCIIVTVNVLFGEPEVCNFYVSVVADKHIFWLQVSVKNVLGVQMMQRQKYVRGVESGRVLLESPDLGQVEKQLSSWAVLQHEKQFAVALEGVVHLDDEWVPDVLLQIGTNI